MLLYNAAISGNCYKARLLLAQLGIDYERREVDVFDRSQRPELLGGLSPALRVPVLVLDDGRPLAESNAILHYLAQGSEYLPQDRYEHAQVLQWMFFEQYEHEPAIAIARFWELAGLHRPEEELQSKLRAGNRALAALERHLAEREFLVAERYTIADIALYAYTHVAPEGGFELTPYDAVRAWLARVAAVPGHIEISE
ncbi:MAG TPA: glutathione S-transferase family protein [Solirubrobacteraceae bacterium]|jgi:glutathione S-transferase